DLHREVDDEERGREQPDRGKTDAVRARLVLRDRADVRDVPAARQTEGRRADERAPHARAYAIRPPASRIARSRLVNLVSSGAFPNAVSASSSSLPRSSGISHAWPSSVRS